MLEDINHFYGLNCTINTTEDCNLRCKYCYETNKRPVSIDFEKCKKFIDMILEDTDFCLISSSQNSALTFNVRRSHWDLYKGRVIDFIGGDALINPNLLDKILTYFNTKWSLLPNKPLYGWRASITSNGTLFERKDVRDFCEKWKNDLSLTVSIDGCPEIHDMNRVFPDGSGSMKAIMEWWPWYRKTFPTDSMQTKATCSRNTIPYLYDSLIFMHETLGLSHIYQNFIMEETGCTEEDYKELDKQLEKCCEYCLEHRNDLFWAPLSKQFLPSWILSSGYSFDCDGKCGSGCMPCLSVTGDIYPCFRWLPHTQNGKEGVMKVGSTEEGWCSNQNFKKVADGAVRINCTRDAKCLHCEYEPCCSYCIGGCYAEYGDFIRTTHICEITKLQCKWAKIYWEEYEKLQDR